jgi:hypothetical protein
MGRNQTEEQRSAVQYSTAQYNNTVLYSTVQYSAVQQHGESDLRLKGGLREGYAIQPHNNSARNASIDKIYHYIFSILKYMYRYRKLFIFNTFEYLYGYGNY